MKNCVATSENGNRFLNVIKYFKLKNYIYINISIKFHKYEILDFGFDDRLTLTEIEMNHTMEVIKKLLRYY